MNDFLTTTQAAEHLNLTVQGVIGAIRREALHPGHGLKARRLGDGRRGMWLVDPESVRTYRLRVPENRRGRPRKGSE